MVQRKEGYTMSKVLLCMDCIEAIRSRGERVFVGDEVERWDLENPDDFKCGWCGDDYLMGDEPQDDDVLYECVW